MKHLYTFVLTWCWVLAAQAHTTLQGRVFNLANGQPIAGAVVQLRPSTAQAYADEHGHFVFKGLAGGTYLLQASMLGYAPVFISVTLKDNDTQEVPLGLVEKNVNVQEVVIAPTQELGTKAIGGLDLKTRPVNNTQDLLRLVPGLFIAQHAGGGKAEQIFLRGFDCDHGTDVAVCVDGMPVNMVSHAHGQGYADLHFVIPELVGGLSFSKGPYDAKTGDLNTAGAVRFTTKNTLPKSFVKLEGGRFGYMRGVGAFNLLGTDTTHARQSAYVATEFVNTDGFFENSQNFKRINLLAKYSTTLDDNTRVSISASHFTSGWDASGQIPDRAVASGLISRFGSIDPTEGGTTSRQNLNLIISKPLANGAVFKNQVFYSHYTFSLFSNFTFLANDSLHGDQIHQYETRDMYGYNGSYSQSFRLGTVGMSTVAGISLRDDNVSTSGLDHTQRRQYVSTERLGTIAQTNAGAYVEQTAFITPRFTVSAGVRLDAFRFRYLSALTDTPGVAVVKAIVSPKLNLSYNLTTQTQVYVSAGTGFHSNDARVATYARSGNTLPRATGADLGINLKPTKRIFVNAALWMLDIESEFVYVGDASIVAPSGYTRRTGIDASIRYQITESLYADFDVNAANPRFTSGPENARAVPLAPRLTSMGGLTVQTKWGLSGSLRYRYLGNRPAMEDRSIMAAGYTLADAVVSYAKGPYLFSASAENLFNVRWKEAQFATESRLKGEATAVNEIHFTPGTPLFIKGGMTYQF
jgi:outer membrane cobalamin receptor